MLWYHFSWNWSSSCSAKFFGTISAGTQAVTALPSAMVSPRLNMKRHLFCQVLWYPPWLQLNHFLPSHTQHTFMLKPQPQHTHTHNHTHTHKHTATIHYTKTNMYLQLPMFMLTVICCVELVCKQRARSWSRGRGHPPTTAKIQRWG